MSFYIFIVCIIGIVLFLGVVPWCCVYTGLRFGGFEGFPVFWRVFYLGAWGGIFLCGCGVIWSWVEIFRGGDPERLGISLSLWVGVFLVFGVVAEYWARRIREIGDRLFSDYKELLVLAVLCEGMERNSFLQNIFSQRYKSFFELRVSGRFSRFLLIGNELSTPYWREHVVRCFLFAACPEARSLKEARLLFKKRFSKAVDTMDDKRVFSCLSDSMELMNLPGEYQELWWAKMKG